MLKRHVAWMLLAVLLVGCSAPGTAGNTGSSSGTSAEASWAYEFVTWNKQRYQITSTSVEKVGMQLGEVTSYSNKETSTPQGNFSNRYPIGTKLYAIPGTDTAKAIAVETAPKAYIRAELIKK